MIATKNRRCPKCTETGHDSKGDHLFLMRDQKTWMCNHLQYHQDRKSYVEGVQTTPRTSTSYTDSVCLFRSIKPEVYDYYGFRGHYDDDDELIKIEWDLWEKGTIIGQKYRQINPKDFWSTKGLNGKKFEFFGQHLYTGGKRLLITEGEQDAAAAYQMLIKYNQNVVSLPIGAEEKAVHVFRDQKDWLSKFKEIILCMDQDDAGEKTVRLIYDLYPDIKVMKLPKKDANEMLEEGLQSEFVDAYFKADKWKPSCLVEVTDALDDAIKPVEWGLEYPWDGLTQMTYGSRGGQIVCIVGAPGSGKSTVLNQLMEHFIYHHQMPIGIFDLENPPSLTLRKLIGSKMNLPIHLPDVKYNEADARAVAKQMDGLVNIYDHSGYRDWMDIKMYMIYLISRGVLRFFIDPLSALVTHLTASEANEYISEAMMDMSKMVQQFPQLQIFHTNHANNGTGKDAGAGGRIYGGQITGSRSQWRFSTDVWTVERDQTTDDPSVKSQVTLRSIKHRMGGNTGTVPLVYDPLMGKCVETTATQVF